MLGTDPVDYIMDQTRDIEPFSFWPTLDFATQSLASTLVTKTRTEAVLLANSMRQLGREDKNVQHALRVLNGLECIPDIFESETDPQGLIATAKEILYARRGVLNKVATDDDGTRDAQREELQLCLKQVKKGRDKRLKALHRAAAAGGAGAGARDSDADSAGSSTPPLPDVADGVRAAKRSRGGAAAP